MVELQPAISHRPGRLQFRGQRPPPGTVILGVHWRDNPWFPEVLRRDMEYDRLRDPERHAHVWMGGYVVRSEAQVFDNWVQLPFDTPADAVFRFGADWGFSKDPTVLVRCFFGCWAGEPGASEVLADLKVPVLFVDDEAYKVGCPITETPALFAGTDQRRPMRWTNDRRYRGVVGADRLKIIADSARPETIDFMKRAGFSIEPAKKGPGSVEDGINFIKTYQLVVHPRCRHLVDELIHYSWAVDRQTGEILNRLADAHNHVIDALRYSVEGAHRARSGKLSFASAGPRVFSPENLRDYSLGGSGSRQDPPWSRGRSSISDIW